MRKKSGAGRRVVKRLADGTTKVYRYPAYKPKHFPRDTIDALIFDWERSPEWRAYSRKTQDLHTIYLRPLGEAVGKYPLTDVDSRAIREIRNLLAEARGNGAANQFVKSSRTLFAWAVENERLLESPVRNIKRLAGGELPAWTAAEAASAIRALPEHLRRAVVLALYTGQRRGDLIRLRWGDYDGNALRLTQEKRTRAKQRIEMAIPCHPVLRTELDAWRSGPVIGLPTAPILTNAKGKPWIGNNLTTQMGQALAKVPGFPAGRNIHGLRKLAAANLAEAGCSIKEICAITGHKTLAMVELYTASADQRRLAEAAVARLLKGDRSAR